MTTVTLTLLELAGIVMLGVALAATDAAAISRMGVAFAGKKLGVQPGDITKYDTATDGDSS